MLFHYLIFNSLQGTGSETSISCIYILLGTLGSYHHFFFSCGISGELNLIVFN